MATRPKISTRAATKPPAAKKKPAAPKAKQPPVVALSEPEDDPDDDEGPYKVTEFEALQEGGEGYVPADAEALDASLGSMFRIRASKINYGAVTIARVRKLPSGTPANYGLTAECVGGGCSAEDRKKYYFLVAANTFDTGSSYEIEFVYDSIVMLYPTVSTT